MLHNHTKLVPTVRDCQAARANAATKACQTCQTARQGVCLFQRTCKTVKNVANLYVEPKNTTEN